jgi:invasion protein IalB
MIPSEQKFRNPGFFQHCLQNLQHITYSMAMPVLNKSKEETSVKFPGPDLGETQATSLPIPLPGFQSHLTAREAEKCSLRSA